MAARQRERHERGRAGEAIAHALVGGQCTCHKAPFDVVDFSASVAYEVKAMSGLSKDLKVHISDASMAKKLTFAAEYGLKQLVLLVVVIYSAGAVEVYSGSLRQSMRVSQMERIK